ncbi:probable DNA replication complex GINS protein PSF2 [Venturia canescens]|uniref:probable DNA replication complex GINS protein PSF2 n=1 Tax=Venturia canescens TaxID=32260 RepID=UPI001C9C9DBA|nr:probable DNA replication complex GINS protein PSF2 [Venturia canescens]
MDPTEVEFMGDKDPISILPLFNLDEVHLISGSLGPFRAGIPIKVPIWMAFHLRQLEKCRIVAPEWMDVDNLNEILANEKLSKNLTQMPSNHYMNTAHMLLNMAANDFSRAEEIRTAVKDIWDMRMAKLRTSIDAFFKSDLLHAQLDNVTSMELNSIRPLLPHALDQVLRIQMGKENLAQDSQRGESSQ